MMATFSEIFRIKLPLFLIAGIPLFLLVLLSLGYTWLYSALFLVPCAYFAQKLIKRDVLKASYAFCIFVILGLNYFMDSRQQLYFLVNDADSIPGLILYIVFLGFLFLAWKTIFKTKKVGMLLQLVGIGLASFFVIVLAGILDTFLLSDKLYFSQACASPTTSFQVEYLTVVTQPKMTSKVYGVVFTASNFLMFQKIEVNTSLKAEDFCNYSQG